MEEGVTQALLAKKIGTTSPYVNWIIKKGDIVINKTFVNMWKRIQNMYDGVGG